MSMMWWLYRGRPCQRGEGPSSGWTFLEPITVFGTLMEAQLWSLLFLLLKGNFPSTLKLSESENVWVSSTALDSIIFALMCFSPLTTLSFSLSPRSFIYYLLHGLFSNFWSLHLHFPLSAFLSLPCQPGQNTVWPKVKGGLCLFSYARDYIFKTLDMSTITYILESYATKHF